MASTPALDSRFTTVGAKPGSDSPAPTSTHEASPPVTPASVAVAGACRLLTSSRLRAWGGAVAVRARA